VNADCGAASPHVSRLAVVLTDGRAMIHRRGSRLLLASVYLPLAMWVSLSSCDLQRPVTPALPNVTLLVTDGVLTPPPPEPMPTFGTTLIHDAFAETSIISTLTNFLPMIGSLGDYTSMDQTGGPNGTTALRIDWP